MLLCVCVCNVLAYLAVQEDPTGPNGPGAPLVHPGNPRSHPVIPKGRSPVNPMKNPGHAPWANPGKDPRDARPPALKGKAGKGGKSTEEHNIK